MVGSLTLERMAGNSILDSLSPAERDLIRDAGDFVALEPNQVLYDFNRPLGAVWFPFSGVVSWTTRDLEGHFVETAIGGRDGFIGVQVLLGGASIAGRAQVQIAGQALEVEASRFLELVGEIPLLRMGAQYYLLALFNQMSQLSLCNRLHPMDERCARWLLMCHDRVGATTFPLTHDYVARMLGVRRASVTVALGVLRAAGIIDYQHGAISILDRAALEASSCQCYSIVRHEYERLLGTGRL